MLADPRGAPGQTSADIALQDRVRTAGTQLRLASWVGFVAPLFVLVLFCTVSPQYRLFFRTALKGSSSSWSAPPSTLSA